MSESESNVPPPYVPRNPGDPITAGDWNKMQEMAFEHIQTHVQTHDHSGGEQGVQITDKAIDKAELTLKKLSVKNGFIMGFSPLFDKTLTIQDQEAVKELKNKPVGTFLIAGPCKGEDDSFRFYWKQTEEVYSRTGFSQEATKLDSNGEEIKEK
jgi:hypothetical protein